MLFVISLKLNWRLAYGAICLLRFLYQSLLLEETQMENTHDSPPQIAPTEKLFTYRPTGPALI